MQTRSIHLDSSGVENDPSNSATPDSEGPTVQDMLEEIKVDFEQRMEELNHVVENAKRKQISEFHASIFKLSSKVRNMKISDFDKDYHCDIVSLITSIRAKSEGKHVVEMVQTSSPSRPPLASQHASKMELETPAPIPRSRLAKCTPSRTVRRGEILYSENGSPLDPTEQGALVATVQKKVRGRTTASFDINVGEGQYLSLDEHQIPHMDDETKNHAINQVKVLQDQLATLMQQLEN